MLLQAIAVGLFYWIMKWTPGYVSFMPGSYSPMFMSVFLGLILGDVTQAVIIGAFIEAVYLGLATDLGGVTTVDKALATCITVPIALMGGIDPEIAVTLAIPFGLLGTLTTNVVKLCISFLCNHCDKLAEDGKATRISVLSVAGPAAFWFVFAAIPVMAIVYLGPDMVQSVLALIPDPLIQGLSVAGGLLPALGFAMIIRIIGRKNFLPFFFLGFFFVEYFGISSIGCAIFGGIAALVYVQLMGGEQYAS
ncbi:MAG TPA: PTS sugar transporter subunit IIC [Candidatus Anaerotruncus excrementipullorum]|uniref:PTS sugar transporter subunit IIC n=1 Tax=Candidatus Anaerotruncus excrementipullorum TaxID=2838465 RepID=A0A9D1WT40_9FIRM|nr:PTS sugar transporter subunit IIC [Candidatus Anaerotruncus excrementipullorum]